MLTLGCGIAALLGETSWALLVLMMTDMVVMWALGLAHDTGYLASGHAAKHGRVPA